jgi:hypothetical protein
MDNEKKQIQNAIALLETKKKIQFADLRQQLHITGSHLKPSNIITRMLVDFNSQQNKQAVALNTLLNIGVKYISSKLITSKYTSSVKSILKFLKLWKQ